MTTPTTIDYEKLPNPNLVLTLLDKLGEGTYGQVYRAKFKDSSECVAAKIIPMPMDQTSNEFESELNILKKISKQTENVPDFIGIFADSDTFHAPRVWFVMELCSRGPISRVLKEIEQKGALQIGEKEKLVAYALKGTLNALSYLHGAGVMHRDVKGSHILVTEDYIIKLIDFGVAALFDAERPKRNSSVGTSLWMAPEVIACAHQLEYVFDERCDIWSLGITAIELADGEAPMADLHPTKVLFEVPRRPPPTLSDAAQWSDDFSQFIAACLVKDYEHRPSAAHLLAEEPFINFDPTTTAAYRQLLEDYHQRVPQTNEPSRAIEIERSTVVNDDDDDAMSKNPWIANISRPAQLIATDNNLAEMDHLDQQRLLECIRRRFSKGLIYTYIGDVLLAINPKQFLPIDHLNFQLKYLKVRQDLLPHIFAMATKVYNQMMISKQAQCIILSGESGSGKTHAAQNLISELALLGFGEQRALENRLVTMNLLLESFGNAQTPLNNNSSRFGKLLDIFFSEYGTIVYVQLAEFLLEKTRVVLASGNRRNFHVFYIIHSHFVRGLSNPCDVADDDSFDLLRTVQHYTYLGSHHDENASSLTLTDLFQILKELNVTDDEQSSILAILTATIHLGNVSFKADAEITEPGCSIDEKSLAHCDAVYRLLKIDREQFVKSLCQSSLMTRGETVTKLNTVAEAQQARDAMAKSLYSRLFDWIIFALNRYFRTELEYRPKSIVDIRKRYGKEVFNNGFSIRPKTSDDVNRSKREDDLCSISILDLFGFETFDHNSYEQLCINIANEQLQYFFRQHTFAWEMKEYENEGIRKADEAERLQFPNNRSILDMCLSKPIGLLALLDEESRFPQSTEYTLVDKWRENLDSPHFRANISSASLSRKSVRSLKKFAPDRQPLFTIRHYAGSIEYTAKDFLEKNRDYVPMEIIDLLLQSDDDLVNLLFRSRLRKTGSVMYTEQEKQEKTTSLFRTSPPKTTTGNRTQGTVSTYFRYSLMELVSTMASAQPTFIRCLVPNRSAGNIVHTTYDHTSYFPQNFAFDAGQFDEAIVLEQVRYSGLLETIDIRRNGYSHRILFEDFVAVYACLLGLAVPHSHGEERKATCELILKKFDLTDYAIGKTKVFLKFQHVEQLNAAHKALISKLIRLQSRLRTHLVQKQCQRMKASVVKSEYEESVGRLQAIVRSFLVQKAMQKAATASLTIQAYWRMWYERTRFKRRLLHYRNQQIQVSYFLKQIELFGSHLHQQLIRVDTQTGPSTETETKLEEPRRLSQSSSQPKLQNTANITGKRKVVLLCEYYDAVHRAFLNKKSKSVIDENKKETGEEVVLQRPATAPPASEIPQAPPCPPPEFFQQTSTEIRVFKRQKSAPATIKTPVDELKQIFATRQPMPLNPVFSAVSFRPLSPPPSIVPPDDRSMSHTFLAVKPGDHAVRQDEYVPRRRRSSASSIVKSKTTGMMTSSTSNLVGDMILTSNDVLKLKNNLRKTGLVERNETLRRKLPTETVQIDFRSVLRSSKTNIATVGNK